MIWPPVKAWTSKCSINGNFHFVAINYGGKGLERWVLLISVLDSTIVVRVPWPKLVNQSNWKCGWDQNHYSVSSKLVDYKYEIEADENTVPSIDSGLTIPINKKIIRPWFENV